MGLVSYGERAVSQTFLVKGHYQEKLSSMVLSVLSAHFSRQLDQLWLIRATIISKDYKKTL